ncbi:hypothetical protein ASPVEDRAFT_208993 [Aspergillus versicolor CBS 583.65]|uniref:Uncharacterized protein n=1 Tax=Aspergillus versicolor CBS 583.65 TaxID=1036611 RepID=A0A1L9P313_ASPVE|nr:uncharacterized protein ASPVEDRAFT_208993 [Aspergillus versicolor CBS 583.65]OJI95915.1 hypothetical protein ASPVEDRAFT_208993 [Aspergillus versicolor CBS 583.65]
MPTPAATSDPPTYNSRKKNTIRLTIKWVQSICLLPRGELISLALFPRIRCFPGGWRFSSEENSWFERRPRRPCAFLQPSIALSISPSCLVLSPVMAHLHRWPLG